MRRFVATLAAALPSVTVAQEWVVQSGVAGRGEFNDNYFLTPSDQESAFTASVSPFVTAARRTETSDVSALIAVGLNRVWGLSSTTDYVSGRLGLTGTVNDERSTWTGGISFSRAPVLQNAQTQEGVTLVRVYTNASTVNGTYTYALRERWSVGATAGLYRNDYEAIEGDSATSDNSGYYAGPILNYQYSERTRVTVAAIFSHFSSDITRNDAVTTTLGIAHEFSPQLSVSASVGGFWSDIEAEQTALVCPTTPILCDTGVAQRVPVTSGERRRDSGPLFGGSINYAYSERTRLFASLTQGLSPDSTGTVTRTNNAGAGLSHQFSERLVARLGVGYTRTTFPTALSGSFANETYLGEIGASYRLAERWILDAGYRYTRADYADNPSQPTSNIVFISIGYNWPGTSFTDWVGTRVFGADPIPGAGPISFPERRPVPTDAAPPSGPPESSPFDAFPIP